MADAVPLKALFMAIANADHSAAAGMLDAVPSLVTERLARSDEFFLAERRAQVYEGDTALHAAAFTYDVEMARDLVGRGADVRARNRRGAEPLHSSGSTAADLAQWTTGRDGTGSAEAKAEQQIIVDLLGSTHT